MPHQYLDRIGQLFFGVPPKQTSSYGGLLGETSLAAPSYMLSCNLALPFVSSYKPPHSPLTAVPRRGFIVAFLLVFFSEGLQ